MRCEKRLWAVRYRIRHCWGVMKGEPWKWRDPYLATDVHRDPPQYKLGALPWLLFETREEAREQARKMRRSRSDYKVYADAVRVTVTIEEGPGAAPQ